MRVKVILNPASHHGRAAAYADPIRALGEVHGGLELVQTEGPGHAKELAAEAAGQGYDVVAAAGGDGTVHEVVNGLAAAGSARPMLGVVPIGSGNDFAYALGLSSPVPEAIGRLFTGRPRPFDAAVIEDNHGRRVIVDNSIGIGFDASVTIQSRAISRVHGFPMYALATMQTIARHFGAPHLELLFDGDRVTQAALLLAIGVGPRAGGGFLLTPEASHHDGLLDSCTVVPVSRLTMLAMLPRVMKGTHVTSRHVRMRRNHTISIDSEVALPIHIDGEIFAFPADGVHQLTVTSAPAFMQVVHDARPA